MKVLFLIISVFLFSCTGKIENKKQVNLSTGKKIEVNFEKQIHEERGAILFVDYRNEERVIKEKKLYDEVTEIWNGVKEEADKDELTEALIKYSYFTGNKKDSGEKEYASILFNAEKIESGSWKLIKVN